MSWDYSCEQTGKRRYPTTGDVAQAISKTVKRGMKQKSYRCPACGGYHLTHFMHETRAKDFHKRGVSR